LSAETIGMGSQETEKYLNYSNYNIYINYKRYKMEEKTTIAVTKEVKKKISEFGNKGETFSDIILKLYNSAVQRQLHDLLFNEEGCLTIEEARKELNQKWPRS